METLRRLYLPGLRWLTIAALALLISLPTCWHARAIASDGAPTTAPSGSTAIKVGDARVLAIQELGNFPYDPEKGGNIPDRVKALEGATVRLRGFMIPAEQSDKVNKFLLVPSLFSCCYGQPPTVEHTVVVNCPAGQSVEFSPEEVVVAGTLHVKELREDGYIVSVFQVVCKSVGAAPPQPKMPTVTGPPSNGLQ